MTLFYRQKILLSLLKAFGGDLSNVDFQKYLFLYTEKCESDKSYGFVPYKFGCFSFQSYADRRKLISKNYLCDVDQWKLTDDVDLTNSLKKEDQKKIKMFASMYLNLRGEDLIHEVYKKYPYYAIKSEISQKILSKSELEKVENEIPNENSYCFYTIGYEGESFENYLNRLIKNNIKLLCDVRKNPLSRKYGFSKKTLSETLEKLDIAYLHMPELGIVSEKRKELKSQADYDKLFDDYEKTVLNNADESINKLHYLLEKNGRIAVTCFEADHCMCHRGRVAKALTQLPEWEYEVRHI